MSMKSSIISAHFKEGSESNFSTTCRAISKIHTVWIYVFSICWVDLLLNIPVLYKMNRGLKAPKRRFQSPTGGPSYHLKKLCRWISPGSEFPVLYFLVSFAASGVESFLHIAQCTLPTSNCWRVDGEFNASPCKQQTPNLAACFAPLTVDFQRVTGSPWLMALKPRSSSRVARTLGPEPRSSRWQ